MTDAIERNDTTETEPNWADPSVPVGNSPPMPGLRLVVSIVCWVGGIIFLTAMTMERVG